METNFKRRIRCLTLVAASAIGSCTLFMTSGSANADVPPAQTCRADGLGNLHCMPCARVVVVRDQKGNVIAKLCN